LRRGTVSIGSSPAPGSLDHSSAESVSGARLPASSSAAPDAELTALVASTDDDRSPAFASAASRRAHAWKVGQTGNALERQ
jgi:hypothetical protein